MFQIRGDRRTSGRVPDSRRLRQTRSGDPSSIRTESHGDDRAAVVLNRTNQQLPLLDIPNPKIPLSSCHGHDAFSGRVERQMIDGIARVIKITQRLGRRDIPKSSKTVTASGDDTLSIWAEPRRRDVALVSHSLAMWFAGAAVPKLRRVVIAGRDNELPHRVELGVSDNRLVLQRLTDGLAISNAPQARRIVGAGRDQSL